MLPVPFKIPIISKTTGEKQKKIKAPEKMLPKVHFVEMLSLALNKKLLLPVFCVTSGEGRQDSHDLC